MIQDWQLNVLNKIQGIKKGQLSLTMSSRQTGKSQMQAYMRMWNDIQCQPVEDLKLSEGTVYGSRYYCVEPVGGSWFEMETWCTDTFGDPGDRIWDSGPAPLPAKRWYMNNRKFWFRDDADRLMFVMRWR
jgi:hypothetical protein